MRRKAPIFQGVEITRPQLVVTRAPLDFESKELSRMEDSTRLVLQILGEELVHELECSYCRKQREKEVQGDLPGWMIGDFEEEV